MVLFLFFGGGHCFSVVSIREGWGGGIGMFYSRRFCLMKISFLELFFRGKRLCFPLNEFNLLNF